jgi:tetratricopeptide (TPR) repeat protein
MNRLQDCRRDYEIALAIQENEADHDDARVAFMLHNMGNLETGSGRYEEALEYYNKAIKIRQQQGDRSAGQLALTYLCVGRLFYFRGMYEEASKYLASSEALFVRTSGADTHFMAL